MKLQFRLFWQNTKRNIKTDCFSSDNLIYRDNMYIIAIIYFDTEIKNDKSAKKIKLDVFKNNEWIQLKVDKGIPASKICVNPTFQIVPEKQT